MSKYLRFDTQKVLQTTLTCFTLSTLCLIISVLYTSFTLMFPFVIRRVYHISVFNKKIRSFKGDLLNIVEF